MTNDATPNRFSIEVDDSILSDLQMRLTNVRWPDEISGSAWTYGTDLAYLKQLVAYWRDGYDWRMQERRLNEFTQYTVPIGAIDLHFIHQPGVGPSPLPLLLLHGWPGSVWEFNKLIPLLADPARFGRDPSDAFTVVAPSLPGFGFSFHPNQPRLDRVAMADVLTTLMTHVLGYERFCAQGGDIGAGVVARMAAAFPDRLFGIHLNFLGLGPSRQAAEATDEERQYAADQQSWTTEETGYQWIQGTKPQTLAYGLTDSPVGLAAWIVEKFRSWSDCDGDVENVLTKDDLLTDVMLYWVTGAINSAFWPYYSRHHGDWALASSPFISVPAAYIAFPKEILRPPRSMAERILNIQRWTTMHRGGHFAALEQPEELSTDIRSFFRQFRSS